MKEINNILKKLYFMINFNWKNYIRNVLIVDLYLFFKKILKYK